MTEHATLRRARVFISCGQNKKTNEVMIAGQIREKLEKLGFDPYIAVEAHPAVPGWSICSMRVPCAGDQRRAGGDIGWLGRDR